MDLSFSIGPDKYVVPKQITVGGFARAIVWDLEDPKNIDPFVATIIGCPISALHKLDKDVYDFIQTVCLQRAQITNGEFNEVIDGYKLMDFDEMTYANFIDLDVYISKGVGENLAHIVSMIYGVPLSVCELWNCQKIWKAVEHVARWRKSVYTEYEEFFELADQPEASEESKESNIALMWWEATIALANEDFYKIHQVVERPYRECLNYLTWKKAKAQKEKLENLRRKHDIQRSTR
tara:strand:+ start:334 stop:1041 length:708 start_codon:yes stop_codon:yes gene_type:complete